MRFCVYAIIMEFPLFFLGEQNYMNEFKPGDVVVLKSGGPKMTVAQAGYDNYNRPTVWCDWFEGHKKVSATFPPTSLEHSDK
jgi:uncharacterized protein YodC (DUF2158 family)